MRNWKFIGGVVIIFAGCSSFNRYTYITPQQQQEQAKAQQIEQKAARIVAENVCPKADFTRLPDAPVVPTRKWQAAPDDKALEGAMMDHIEAQKAYIRRLKDQITRERDQYSTRCADYIRTQQNNPGGTLPPSPN